MKNTGFGTRRAPIKTVQGPYPRRALSRSGGGPQSRYHSSLGWDRLLPGIVPKRNSRLVSPKPRRWTNSTGEQPPPERSVGRYPARATAFGLNRVHYTEAVTSWCTTDVDLVEKKENFLQNFFPKALRHVLATGINLTHSNYSETSPRAPPNSS